MSCYLLLIGGGKTAKRKEQEMIKLQFFSGCASEDAFNESSELERGYDGSMSVQTFDPADLPKLAERMDCICGVCVCIDTFPDYFGQGRDKVEFHQFVHNPEA